MNVCVRLLSNILHACVYVYDNVHTDNIVLIYAVYESNGAKWLAMVEQLLSNMKMYMLASSICNTKGAHSKKLSRKLCSPMDTI